VWNRTESVGEMNFKQGDEVRLRANHSKIGIVKIFDFDQSQSGYVRVYWLYSNRSKMVRESDIELNTKEPELDTLDYVDACMQYLGSSLNLLDPEGMFKSMPSEETFRKLMKAVREDYRKLSDAIHALREDNSQDLAQKILELIERHQRETMSDQNISETTIADKADALIDDIEKLCKEQLKEDK
jgi:DNA-binding ferritin-like protein (Dps family)